MDLANSADEVAADDVVLSAAEFASLARLAVDGDVEEGLVEPHIHLRLLASLSS